MRVLGLDIGSTTIKFVLMEDGRIVFTRKFLTGHGPLEILTKNLKDINFDKVIATGYGRKMAQELVEAEVVTEIKAFAIGAKYLAPPCRSILDIGGQDTKAISLNKEGKVMKFEMNDKCAAGTGRFLEVMANRLGYSLEEFGRAAFLGRDGIEINSMCTVFAESEVISLITRGIKREDIAKALHKSIMKRILAMLKRVGIKDPLFFAGGVAYDPFIKHSLEKSLSISVIVPEDPQIVGALGVALLGAGIVNPVGERTIQTRSDCDKALGI